MSRFDTVDYEVRDTTAIITLNRPDTRNAQNMRLILDLDLAFDEAQKDDRVRVVVLRGAGKSFSSGHDLSIVSDAGAGDALEVEYLKKRALPETLYDHEAQMYVGKCLRIRDFPKPTIAMVHGACIAAGWMVASMCDLIVAAENAYFCDPVARMACVGVEIPVEFWDVGVRKAKELLFTGDKLSAREGQALGFVNQVVADDELETFTLAMAQRIGKVPPVALKLIKQSMNRSLDHMGQSTSFQQHFTLHQFAHQSQEFKDFIGQSDASVSDFVARRDAPAGDKAKSVA